MCYFDHTHFCYVLFRSPQAVAASLNISSSRVKILQIVSGSVIITVEIAADPTAPSSSSSSSAQSTPLALAQTLLTMASNPNSVLSQNVEAQTNTSVVTTFVPPLPQPLFNCPDGSVQTSCSSTLAPKAAPEERSMIGAIVGGVVGGFILLMVATYYVVHFMGCYSEMKKRLLGDNVENSSADVAMTQL